MVNTTRNEIDLAVYMERLDTYIDTQSRLNITLCEGLEKVNDELDELKHWRTKFYGAKSLALLTVTWFLLPAVKANRVPDAVVLACSCSCIA